ncbi:MAG: ATP synthase F1 subunit epsilon [Fimbriimonas sp.]
MAREFHLSVVAPDKSVVEEAATSLVAPGNEGYFGVMAGHVPLIAALRPGLLEFADKVGTRHFVYIGGGFVEVTPERVTVLADEAERASNIDLASAERSLEEARRALRGESSTLSAEDAVQEVERAMTRIRAARSAR